MALLNGAATAHDHDLLTQIVGGGEVVGNKDAGDTVVIAEADQNIEEERT